MVDNTQKINSPNYSYGYAQSKYKELKQYEVSMEVPPIKSNESLIVRLDGKDLTIRFKSDEELFSSDFHLAMKRVMESIKKYCPYVTFAYSFKDEISLLLNKEQIKNSRDFQNRIEKVLPILSGYISSMFSQYIPKKLKTPSCEAFSFDARIIIIPTMQLKEYFHSRQAFAMSGFIDRICSFKHLTPESRTFSNTKKELKDIGDDWFNYPQYVCSGYVGRYENDKWIVDTASDFMQKWYDFVKCDYCQTLNIELHAEVEVELSENLKKCKQCNKDLGAKSRGTFLIPDFGFIADRNIKTPTLIKPERTYRTEAAFVNYDRAIPEKKMKINEIELNVSLIDNSAMAILTTEDFYVCQSCGYALEASQTNTPFSKKIEKPHKDSSGYQCKSTKLESFSLGYRFETDVTRIRIDKPCNHEEAYSVLQSLILASCDELNIDHNEIAGCLQYYSAGIFYFILYDTTPGGAGHVKRLNQEDTLKNVFQRAYRKAKNCNCGNGDGDSSCYSCLRTYQNQKYHDIIKRKYVINYLREFAN